jgi:DNA processing protein
LIYCAGSLSLLESRCVAVVGTRKPSRDGAARARRLARELAEAGVVVVSGLALGIDTEALSAAIEAGGRVVAVIGAPVDKPNVVANTELQERIYGDHLLVSQFAPGSTISRFNFPKRNRTMAALSDATVIVEASDTSGTLHQAAECARLGRRLFIARSVVEDRRLSWPASFLGTGKTGEVLDSTTQVLSGL